MPTTFYPRTDASPAPWPYRPTFALVNRGGVSESAPGTTPSYLSVATQNGPAEILIHEALTDIVSSAVTISGTVTFNTYAYENNMSANAKLRVKVHKVAPDGTLTQIVSSDQSAELPTAAASQNWTATPTSTALAVGDQLLIRWYVIDAGTMATGYTVYLGQHHNSTYVTFNEAVSTSNTASGTTFYLTGTASDANPGANTELALSTTPPSSGSATVNTSAAPASPIQWTSTGGGTAVEWYTQQLLAATLSSVGSITVNVAESNAAANATLVYEVYKTNSSGASPTLLAKRWHTAELGTSTAVVTIPVPLSGSLTEGERLKLVLSIDSVAADTTMATGHTATITYLNVGTNASFRGSVNEVPPKFDLLTDSFTSSIDSAVWTALNGATWDSGAGGRVKLPQASLSGAPNISPKSPTRRDLRGSYLFCKFSGGYAGSEYFEVNASYSAFGGEIKARVDSSGLTLTINGSATTLTYSPTDHAWIKFRHTGTTTYIDTSPDGVTWTNRHSATYTPNSLGLTLYLYAGDDTKGVATSNAYVDEFNVAGTASDPVPRFRTRAIQAVSRASNW